MVSKIMTWHNPIKRCSDFPRNYSSAMVYYNRIKCSANSCFVSVTNPLQRLSIQALRAVASVHSRAKLSSQSSAQVLSCITTPVITAYRTGVNANWLMNYEPGPLNRGACAIVRARLGLSATSCGSRWRFVCAAPTLWAWELGRDWLKMDPGSRS